MKFDVHKEWANLDAEQQARIGEAALLLALSQEAQDIAIDSTPTAESRRWERAEQIAHRLLSEAVPCDADLYVEGPDFAALGIRACRECGCTDDQACDGGCEWVEDDLCSRCAMLQRTARHDPGVYLGPCCMCDGTESVNNVIMLSRRGAVPGHGWGCVVCSLPMDGAYAVLCDTCLPKWQADNSLLTVACRGYPGKEGRILVAELPDGEFDHNPAVDHG